MPGDRLSMEAFCRLAREVVESLPKAFRQHLENVVVDVEVEPSITLKRQLGMSPDDDDLFGLFEGMSIAEQQYEEHAPNRILIFKHPIERACRSRAEIAYEIRRTMLHELAHQFGYSEEDLDEFEAQPSPYDDGDNDGGGDSVAE
jgi:predicted Zn-dependent protease with MMP-like domain